MATSVTADATLGTLLDERHLASTTIHLPGIAIFFTGGVHFIQQTPDSLQLKLSGQVVLEFVAQSDSGTHTLGPARNSNSRGT